MTLPVEEQPFEVLNFDREGRPLRGSSEEGDLVEVVFRFYRRYGYPHIVLSDADIHKEFAKLERTGISLSEGDLRQNMVALTLANGFHPEMLGVRCRNFRTPLEVFSDDDLLREAIRKRIRYGSHLKRWGIRKAIHSMRRTQRVSNFRPATAKTIYQFFQPTLVVDFSAGWGGRMLGAMAAGVPYVGIDPHKEAMARNSEMRGRVQRVFSDKQFRVKLICACAEDLLGHHHWSPDLVFTSPPYFDVEKYSDDASQSYIRHPDLDLWYRDFLGACIEGAYRDMSARGHLVLNVNGDMADRTIALATNIGFHLSETWRLVLSQHQYNKSSGTFRYEPVLVFEKP